MRGDGGRASLEEGGGGGGKAVISQRRAGTTRRGYTAIITSQAYSALHWEQ